MMRELTRLIVGATLAIAACAEPRHAENGIRYEGDGPAIELTLVREPRRDSMSGAYFVMTARLVLGAEELRGCALPGQP
jgi:uncharacterized membrane protein